MPFRFATWVGYDMDGRTDIGWATSMYYRLREKAMRLATYSASLADIGAAPDIADRLSRAAQHAEAMAALLRTNLDAPADLSAAANRLTADDADKLVSLTPIIEALEALAGTAETPQAKALLVLTSAMRADGLGMGWIHFRVNASQLHNAIRRRIDTEQKLDLSSRSALIRLRALLKSAKPLRTNFAALSIEDTTAVRVVPGDGADLETYRCRCADPHVDRRMRRTANGVGGALFRPLVRGGGQGRCFAPVRNRKRDGAWRAVPRRVAGRTSLSGLCPRAGPRGDPDGVFRCRALCRAIARRACHRATARPAGADDGEAQA